MSKLLATLTAIVALTSLTPFGPAAAQVPPIQPPPFSVSLIPGGGITNAMLANSSLTIGTTSISLGGTATTLAGITSLAMGGGTLAGNNVAVFKSALGDTVSLEAANSTNKWSLADNNGPFVLAEQGVQFRLSLATGDSGDLEIGSGASFAFGSTTSAMSTIDTGLSRDQAGVVDFGNGTQGDTSGRIKIRELQVTKTSNFTVLTGQTNAFFDNTGAAGEVDFTLPAYTAGLRYCFAVTAAQTLKVIAPASNKIAIGATNSATAGNITANAVYSTICLYATTVANQWASKSATGTWTVN